MNGVPMKFVFSKTLNEQLDTFNYYYERYCSYELQINKLQQEVNTYKDKYQEMVLECQKLKDENKVFRQEIDGDADLIKKLQGNIETYEYYYPNLPKEHI